MDDAVAFLYNLSRPGMAPIAARRMRRAVGFVI